MEMFTTCTTCAVVVVNGDDSVWDHMTHDQRTSAVAALEAIGMYEEHTVGHAGYFECFVCDEIHVGTRHTFASTF